MRILGYFCPTDLKQEKMTIERTADAIIVKLPTNIKIEELQRFLNYLRYKEITAKSEATPADADELAKVANKSWWEAIENHKDKIMARVLSIFEWWCHSERSEESGKTT